MPMLVRWVAWSFKIDHDLFPAFKISWHHRNLRGPGGDFSKSNACFAPLHEGFHILFHSLPVAFALEKCKRLFSASMGSCDTCVEHSYQPGLPALSIVDFSSWNMGNPYHRLSRVVALHTNFQEAIFESFELVINSFRLPEALNVIVQFRVSSLIHDPSASKVLSNFYILVHGFESDFVTYPLSFRELSPIVVFHIFCELILILKAVVLLDQLRAWDCWCTQTIQASFACS